MLKLGLSQCILSHLSYFNMFYLNCGGTHFLVFIYIYIYLYAFTGCLRVVSPSKSDTIKKKYTREHINSQSSHSHCSIYPVWGLVCCQQDFLTCPRAVFLLSFKHCLYFCEMFQGLDMINVDCSSRKSKSVIKQQSV